MEQHGKHKLKIVNKLGKGAFGLVYKGVFDGQTVAVKTAGEDEEDVAYRMIAREAQVLQQCRHGRIIGFKALCRLNTDHKRGTAGKWALVLEYAKGGTLQDKVSASMISAGGKVYSNAQALSWALDVASALEYLHAKRPTIYHRDIKLSNIVLAAEEGQLVAKVNDFGLHVVADDTRDRLLRVSFSCGPNTVHSHFVAATCTSGSAPCTPHAKADSSSTGNMFSTNADPLSEGSGSNLTPQCIQALQQRLAQAADAAAASPSNAAVPPCFDKDSARQQHGRMPRQQRLTVTDDISYGEMHDSNGSQAFLGPPPRSKSSPEAMMCNALNQAMAEKQPQPPNAAAATGAASAATAGPAARALRAEPQWNVPFQQQQLPGGRGSYSFTVSGGAGAAGASAGAGSCNSMSWAAHSAAYQSALNRDTSICSSMATDCTWATDGTAAADGSSDDASSRTDVETVFNMTGQTGSCMYMSPEVYLRQPYNEKADVFSFGVVLYELLARVLLIFTELPTNASDLSVTEWYAAKVAGGYRPAKPNRMPYGVWRIIEACWQQEPCNRPSMSQVVSELQQLLQEEQQAAAAGGGRRSFSLASNRATTAAAAASSAVRPQGEGSQDTATTAPKTSSYEDRPPAAAATAGAAGGGLEGIKEEAAAVKAPSCACVIC